MQNQELDPAARSLLQTLEMGAVQTHGNMAVLPLYFGAAATTSYTTLGEALAGGTLIVTEISEGGSVPELAVVNSGELPVLLLDGEELAGAKQNRVLNTTILIRKQSKTTIPVSCTEQGRWAYASARFEDSGVIMHRSARLRKSRSVSCSLARQGAYASDQGEVWESINELQEAAVAPSATSAMRDVFAHRENDLQACLNAFPPVNGQRGLFVFVNGSPVGFDYISADSAYRVLHAKLIGSYSMDAMLADNPETKALGSPSPVALATIAKSFLQKAANSREHRHKSLGHGWDHRFAGEHLVGSSLQYRSQVIHMAFFIDDCQSSTGSQSGMSNSNRRRAHRSSF